MGSQDDKLDVAERLAEKERARQRDQDAVTSGATTPEQLAQDNASFAFGPDRARINLQASKRLA